MGAERLYKYCFLKSGPGVESPEGERNDGEAEVQPQKEKAGRVISL